MDKLESNDLQSLANARFGELWEAELRLLQAATKAETARCGPSPHIGDPGNDPSKAELWGDERTIRADLIIWLCLDLEASKKIDPAGIQVLGAKIVGRVTLFFADIRFPLLFQCCYFANDIDLKFASVPALNLAGTWIHLLIADGLHVRGDVSLDGLVSIGEVRLLDAQIGASLTCLQATFQASGNSVALALDRAEIKSSILLSGARSAHGETRLASVKVGQQIICDSGEFRNLNLQGAKAESFIWRNVRNAAQSRLDLINASVDVVLDDQASWPEGGNLFLDGFTYNRFLSCATDAKHRMEWLNRQGDFKPQPYLQLSKVLRDIGDERGARLVVVEMENRSRAINDRKWFQRLASQILKVTIGYGQFSSRALKWMALLTLIGAVFFGCGYLGGALAPTEEKAYEVFAQRGYPPDYYSQFNPLVYSIEHSFPLVNLGVKDHWAPNHAVQSDRLLFHWRIFRWLHGATIWNIHIFRWNATALLRLWLWFEVPLGWLLATLFLAGFTGVVKR
jgi:hypothetical protein